MSAETDGPNDGAADLAAIRAEVAALQARLDEFERILQLRDAALIASLTARQPPPAVDPAVSAPSKPDLPANFDLAADQLLSVHDGFYQLEWGAEGAFRWTGPGQDVHFEAWIDRSAPLVATLCLFHFGTPANAKELTLEVDGATYPLARQGGDKVLRSDPIAPRQGDGPTRLTLRVPHLHAPAARGQADRRTLGVAFQRLSIEPA